MNFTSHEQIDRHYKSKGLDIDALKQEFAETLIYIRKRKENRKDFLKSKMGKLRYWFWDSFSSSGLGWDYDKYNIKAKKFGFDKEVAQK